MAHHLRTGWTIRATRYQDGCTPAARFVGAGHTKGILVGHVFDDISGGAVRRVCVAQGGLQLFRACVVCLHCLLDQGSGLCLDVVLMNPPQEAVGVSIE